MRYLRFIAVLFLLILNNALFAQESEVVTDEELKKYAVVMDSVEQMSNSLLETITELVKNNDQITAARYNDLNKVIDDEAKLKELEATAEEVAAVKAIVAKKEEGTAHIQETFMTMATEYVGAATYNKVKKALADPNVKSRYDTILAELNKDDSN